MKKMLVYIPVLILALLLSSCANDIGENGKKDSETGSIEDFSFSLTWGCSGEGTYDSETGKLVKERGATHIEDYTTTYYFTDEQKTKIYDLIVDMKPETYPDEYNPIKGMSAPDRYIVLKVTYNGVTKTITCKNVSLGDTPDGDKGEKFMKVHDAIVDIITASDEWGALPDYEVHYD